MPQNRNLKINLLSILFCPSSYVRSNRVLFLKPCHPKLHKVFNSYYLGAVLAIHVSRQEHCLGLSLSLLPTRPDSGEYVPLHVCNPAKKVCVLRHRKGWLGLCHLINQAGSPTHIRITPTYTLTGIILLWKTAELSCSRRYSASPRFQNSDEKNENK